MLIFNSDQGLRVLEDIFLCNKCSSKHEHEVHLESPAEYRLGNKFISFSQLLNECEWIFALSIFPHVQIE